MTKSQNYRLCKVGRDHRGFICSRMCNMFAHPYTGVTNARQDERQNESLKGARKKQRNTQKCP